MGQAFFEKSRASKALYFGMGFYQPRLRLLKAALKTQEVVEGFGTQSDGGRKLWCRKTVKTAQTHHSPPPQGKARFPVLNQCRGTSCKII
ncbi:MAG: hypothetical protein ACSHWZ_03845 [Sulfitobacter sp.]